MGCFSLSISCCSKPVLSRYYSYIFTRKLLQTCYTVLYWSEQQHSLLIWDYYCVCARRCWARVTRAYDTHSTWFAFRMQESNKLSVPSFVVSLFCCRFALIVRYSAHYSISIVFRSCTRIPYRSYLVVVRPILLHTEKARIDVFDRCAFVSSVANYRYIDNP